MFPGFNRKKRGTISKGDWDRDGKPNRGDCNAFDWRKQDGGEPFVSMEGDLKRAMKINEKAMRETNDPEEVARLERINSGFSTRMAKERLEYHRLKNMGVK